MYVDKSRSPYYDDFNEDKQYHEILYIPGRAVQVRELNQIQSMFYSQLNQLSDHLFKEGSVVIPGETNYDLELKYVMVDIANIENVIGQLGQFDIKLVGSSGITANVKIFTPPETPDLPTFFVEYIEASDDGGQKVFADNEVISVISGSTPITTATVIGTGLGSKFTINSGVYYINGRYVYVPAETIVMDKYNNAPSKIVCIEYRERIITENEDDSLFDNAQGTPNFTAPGAHRLRVDTNLAVFDISEEDTIGENYVQVFKIVNGEMQEIFRGPDYNILGDVIAKRTYEEAGDYTVEPFTIGFGDYDTVFKTTNENLDGSKFAVQLDPGIAYVRGYRIETNSKTNIKADKARDTGIINNSSISASLGYYIEVENMTALPSVATLQPINFKDVNSDIVGTAKIRFISKVSSNLYRLYIFDVKDVSGLRTTTFIPNVTTIDSSTTVNFTSDVVDPVIKEAANNSLIFPMNVEFVKTLMVNNGQSDTSYSSIKQITGTTTASGQLTIPSGSNEVFISQDPRYSFGSFTDDDTEINVAANYSLGGNPTGSTITINLGVGNATRPVRLNLQIAKQDVIQKVKTSITTTTVGDIVSSDFTLGKADAYELISVLDSDSNDITSLFTLQPNKTNSYYGVSFIRTGAVVTGEITVEFKYFAHSSGDYFASDSYVDIDYDSIPVENGIRLTDVLDFRPRMDDSGVNFTGVGSVVGNIPTPFSVIRTDIEHYLSRIDKVFVNPKGQFGIAKGVPGINPSAPNDPSSSMILYKLYVPPYTFSTADIRAELVNNRRYTMRDIGNFAQRISNIEYYVSLNLLEQETEATQVTDPVTGNNRFKNGFFTDRFIDHSVSDYSWDGYHVAISPESGELRPDFSLNAIDLEFDEAASSGVVINDNIVTLAYNEVSYIKQDQRSKTINVNPYAVYRWNGTINLNPMVDTWIDTKYADPDVTYRLFNNGNLTQTWNSWGLTWTGGTVNNSTSSVISSNRWGTTTSFNTNVQRTDLEIVDEVTIDTSVVPFMRTIDIQMDGRGNRPKSRLHFFFDDVNIDAHVRPDGGNFGDPVFSDIFGDYHATFRIPNSDALKFRTGEKSIIATDDENNQRQLSTSYSSALFSSTGMSETNRQTIIATRNITRRSGTSFRRSDWVDPLAQSFLIESAGGAFITKINTYFSDKDDTVPVTLQIRDMENGVPTNNLIPGGEVLLTPDEVNISADGSVPTEFKFKHPIYLNDGTEYCFVLMSNSDSYFSHIGVLGEKDLGSERLIMSQPYAGVMFKSQNNSTWTEDQLADLQFEIFVAKFDTGTMGTMITHNKDFNNIFLKLNPLESEFGSDELVVNYVNHNYTVGTTVTLSNVVGESDFTEAELNKDHVVTEVINPNKFKIFVGVNAGFTRSFGGNNVEISETIQASSLSPNIPTINLPDTSMRFSMRGTSGRSVSGSETPYIIDQNYTVINNKSLNNLSKPILITNRNDEDINLSSEKSFIFRTDMTTDNANISPVIDLSSATIIAPFAQVIKDENIVADGSNNWSNYRTRINRLSNPADMLRVYLDIKTLIASDVVITVRVANSEDELEDSPWEEIPNISSDTPVDDNQFYEYSFEKTGLPEFTFYQVMIQLKSANATKYPMCKKLRVIALSNFV